VTNIDNDHIGLDGIETLDHMAQLKGIVARIARGTAVLNADDERLVELAQRCTRAERIAWVTMRADNPLVRLHIRYGGIAGVFEQAPKGGTLTLYDGGLARPVAPAADLPITMGGLARHNVQNALFAAVIAYAGGASVPEIQRGLRSFTPSWETTPGRLNLYRGHSFDVLMDYGHNPSGFRAIGELALRLRARRRICVVGYPGNRRDADIGEAARALVPYFDLFVCRGEDDPRGRPPEQIPRMLERAFRDAGVSNDRLVVVLDEAGGIDRALALAEPGDLVVVFAADLERTWKQIVGFEGQVPAVRETRASFTS
jgi:cyanophycin synthetase